MKSAAPAEPKTQPRMLVIRPRRCMCGRPALPSAIHRGLCAPCFVGEAPVVRHAGHT